MSDVIKLLPDHVANQIAAGEVIQRPASLVKELLDNAIDAKSTHIQLIITDAGKTLVQVIDNGVGMSETDARMCWERHATSKINEVSDLFKLSTMGFRGEALASIASVAKVELKTKREVDELGTFIVIEGSEVIKQENIAVPTGTSVAVKNLFYNIPARRNFLKSNAVEFKHIVEEFIRCALANPHVAFSLFHNNENVYEIKPANLQERILQLFTDKKTDDLIPLDEHTTMLHVNGFVGTPSSAKRLRGEQFLFVNNRFVKDAYINHAITTAYEGLISKEQFPFYVIKIQIDPAQIDVNIHPTKTEIKFEDDKHVYQIMRAVAKKALSGFAPLSSNTNDFDDNGFIHHDLAALANRTHQTQPQQTPVTVGNAGSNFNNFKDQYILSRQKQNNWDLLFKNLPDSIPEPAKQAELPLAIAENEQKRFFQLHNQYIVTQIKSGLMLIEQQRAHERVLFERYLVALDKNPIASQQLLFPKAVHVSAADEGLLAEILPELKSLGFNINPFGKQTYVINGLPPELHINNEQQVIDQMLDQYKLVQKTESNKKTAVAKLLAKQAAIKKGTRLNNEEMSVLIDELFACKDPKFAPDGKSCVKTLSLEEVSRMF
jgi:DNA mismatch repair protein MutL